MSFSAASAAPPKLLEICSNQVENNQCVPQQLEEAARLLSMLCEASPRWKLKALKISSSEVINYPKDMTGHLSPRLAQNKEEHSRRSICHKLISSNFSLQRQIKQKTEKTKVELGANLPTW